MGRSRAPYGGGHRGTGLKVGRASRRRRHSFWRTYIWTPLVTLILLGAAGLVVAVAVDYLQQPAAQQAASTTHPHGHQGGSTPSQHGHGGTSGPSPTGGKSKGSGTVPGGGAKSRPAKGGKSTTPASKPGAPAGSSTVRLVHAAAGVDTYATRSGPLTATVHVAWLTWVRVLSDGKLAFLHEEPTGFTRTFTARTSLAVYLGFPLDSTVTVNGTRLGPFTGKSTVWVDVGTDG